jgi:hypothetical protein
MFISFYFLDEDLGEPLRGLCPLASGYPLHHLLARFAVSQVVPLLSLSQKNAPIFQNIK